MADSLGAFTAFDPSGVAMPLDPVADQPMTPDERAAYDAMRATPEMRAREHAERNRQLGIVASTFGELTGLPAIHRGVTAFPEHWAAGDYKHAAMDAGEAALGAFPMAGAARAASPALAALMPSARTMGLAGTGIAVPEGAAHASDVATEGQARFAKNAEDYASRHPFVTSARAQADAARAAYEQLQRGGLPPSASRSD